MKTKAKKVIFSMMSLALAGTFGITAFTSCAGGDVSPVRKNGGNNVVQSGDALDVTDRFRGKLDTSKFVNSELTDKYSPEALKVRDDGTRRIIVEFETDSQLDSYLNDKYLQKTFGDFTSYVNGVSGKKYAAQLEKEQFAFFRALDKKAFDYELRHTYTSVLNAVSLEVNDADVAKIEKMSGVKSVIYSERYNVPTVEATENVVDVYSTGIYNSSNIEYKGDGMLVAVLDTGLDKSHNAFKTMPEVQKVKYNDVARVFDTLEAATYGEEITADDVYYNEKVPFAYDYADKDPDVFPKSSYHGVHVAGIIAGQDDSVTAADGEAFENGDKFIGVAPNAQLMIGKVFSDTDDGMSNGAETDDLLAALSDCVAVGADVINMSLGSTCGFSREEDGSTVNAIYDKIYAAGINLVCAASNDASSASQGAYGSTNLTSNPDSSTVGSPATYPAALSVASISGQKSSYMELDDGTAVYFNESSEASGARGDFLKELLNGEDRKQFNYVVVPGYGKSTNYNADVCAELDKGNCVAVVSRGDISFEEKQKIAFDNGAVACVIYNNASGKISASLGTGKKIPTCTVSAEIGQIFVSNGKGTMTLDKTFKAGPFMSDFSSWGPTNDLKIKPEITAHGGEITSAVVGGYSIFSGTSMASPNMAGAETLLRQHVENTTDLTGIALADRVNQLLMSSATIVYDENGLPYAVRKQGAGLGDIGKAINTKAYLYVENSGRTKLELGDDPDRTGVYTMEFHVSNISDVKKTYTLDVLAMTESVSIDNITVSEKAHMLDQAQKFYRVNGKASGRTLTLEAGEDVTVSVTLALSAEEKEYLEKNFKNGMYVEGFVTLMDADGENGVDLSIPYLAFYGDWTDAPIFDMSAYEVSADHYDASIPDEEKRIAAVYESIFIGRYYRQYTDFYMPLGEYIYTLPDDVESGVTSSVDKIAVGNNDYGIYELYAGYFGLLRAAKEMSVRVENAVTGEVLKEEVINNVRKSHGQTPAFATLELSPYDLGLQNNEKYTMIFEAKLDYDNGRAPRTERREFSFYVDYESPFISKSSVRYEYDAQDKRHAYLDLELYDNNYVQSVQLFHPITQDEVDWLTEYAIPVTGSTVRGGIAKLSVEITDYIDICADSGMADFKNAIGVRLDDFALNGVAYRVSFPESTVDTVDVNYTYEAEDGSKVKTSVNGQKILLQLGKELDLTEDSGRVYNAQLGREVEADFSVNMYRYAVYTCNHLDAHGIECGYTYDENKGLAYKKGEYYYDEYAGEVLQRAWDDSSANPTYPAKTKFTSLIAEEVVETIDRNGRVQYTEPATKHFVCPKCGTEVQFTFNRRTGKVTPREFTNQTQDAMIEDIIWQSENESVVRVENGKLFAVGAGVATVKAYSPTIPEKDAFTFEVEVSGEASEIVVDEIFVSSYKDLTQDVMREIGDDYISVDCGTVLELYPDFKPWYITGVDDLTWTSSNPRYAEVLESSSVAAKVVCKKEGAASILLSSSEYGLIGSVTIVIGKEYTLLSYYCYEYNGTGYSETYEENGETRNMLVIPANLGIVNLGYFSGRRNGPFYENQNLDTVVVPQGVTTIGMNTFASSTLRRIYLPSSIEVIAANAFANCPDLEEVYWFDADEKKNTGIKYDATNNTYNWDVFYGNASENCSAKSIVLGSNAFAGDTSLTVYDFSRTTAIYSYAFAGCTALTEADLSKVRFSGQGLFNQCSALTDVTLSQETVIGAASFTDSGLKKLDFYGSTIADGLFYQSDLEEIVIHNDIDKVGRYAFYGCEGLTKVTFEGSCGEIGVSAFDGCSGLTSVTLPEDLKVLGTRAFANCSELETIAVDPASFIAEVGKDLFKGSNKLTKIKIAGGTSNYYEEVSNDGGEHVMLTDKTGTSTVLVPPTYPTTNESEKIFYVPTTVGNGTLTKIGSEAYANNASLDGKEVVIPEGYTSIGEGAFGNTGITKVIIPSTVTEISPYAFTNCTKLETVVFLCELTSLPEGLFYGCTSLKNIQLPETLTEIGKYALALTDISSFTVNEKLEKISDGAFFACEQLSEVVFKKGALAEIGAEAFRGCSALTEISVADSVKTIGNMAFADCASLKNVYVSAGLEEMGEYVFRNSLAVESLEFGYGATVTGSYMFYTPAEQEGYITLQRSLTNVIIPETVKYIGFYAFAGCSVLAEIDIKGAEYIDGGAFFAAQSLKTAYIRDAQYIGAGAFLNSGIENIDLSGVEIFDVQCFAGTNVKTGDLLSARLIGVSAFANCGNITEVNLPNIEYIYAQAFFTSMSAYDQQGNVVPVDGTITSVTLGDKLKGLGGAVFFNSLITEISLPASLEVIGAPAFAGCNNLTSIKVDEENSTFFVHNQGLYQNLPNGTYELVAVPNGLHYEDVAEDYTELKPYKILENTSRVGAWAMGYCGYIHAVEIPASVKAIGDKAFYFMGVEILQSNSSDDGSRLYNPKYIFKGLEAPALEAEYNEEGSSFAELYANYSYPVGASINGALVNDMIIPVNATGFETFVYGYFFATQTYSEEIEEADTHRLNVWLETLDVDSLTLADKATVNEMNIIYNMMSESQRQFLVVDDAANLLADATEKIQKLEEALPPDDSSSDSSSDSSEDSSSDSSDSTSSDSASEDSSSISASDSISDTNSGCGGAGIWIAVVVIVAAAGGAGAFLFIRFKKGKTENVAPEASGKENVEGVDESEEAKKSDGTDDGEAK